MLQNTIRRFWSLITLVVCFFLFSSTALSENGWIKSLKNSAQPGRLKLSSRDVQQDRELARRAVFMKHSTFLLDRTHTPYIQKAEGHIILQLTQPLNPSIEKQLKEYGVKLLEYIPSNAWKARIPAAVVSEVKSFDFVQAMGDIHPVDKFPKHVLERHFSAYSYQSDGTISILVSFHSDIPYSRVLEILADISGTTDQEHFITGQRVLLRIPQEQLQPLAEYDEVNWIEDRPKPKKPHNADAAALSNIDELLTAPYNLDGSGIVIGEWDVGEVQDDHPDLLNRVTVVETGSVSAHSTHVAGTVIGNGLGSANARGMAPSAVLYSYDFYGDVLSEMSSAVSTYSIQLSNNSWGYITGWEYNFYGDNKWVWFDDFYFGAYTSESQAWDQTVLDTGLVIVKSAGNDRNDDGDQARSGHRHFDSHPPHKIFKDYHPTDGDYDCVGDIGSSKNIITVGAVDDLGGMSSFSSWGPTDDGRVKPDIVANGTILTSTCPTSTYCSYSGTSMSTPVVTGALALLIERYVDVYGVDPSPAMMKALLINTAIDKGDTGPDYTYGWGLLDAESAAELIDGTYDNWEDSLSNGSTMEYAINVPASTDVLKVTTAWTDPAGTPGAATALVNDIDLELIDPSAGIHSPWTLDPASPSMPATTGINSVDNVEQVLVDSPEAGLWKIRVIGTSIQGTQSFVIVTNVPVADASSIPTVSEWGMIIFSMLLIVVGMVLIRRQQEQ